MFEDKSPAPIVKIIDFGLCAELKDGQTSSAFVGTMTYAAPEVCVCVCVFFLSGRTNVSRCRAEGSGDLFTRRCFLFLGPRDHGGGNGTFFFCRGGLALMTKCIFLSLLWGGGQLNARGATRNDFQFATPAKSTLAGGRARAGDGYFQSFR